MSLDCTLPRVLIVENQGSKLALPERLTARGWRLVVQKLHSLDPSGWPPVGLIHIPGPEAFAALNPVTDTLQKGSYIALCNKEALTCENIQTLIRTAFHDYCEESAPTQRFAQILERLLSETRPHFEQLPTPSLILGSSPEMTELRHRLSVYGHSELSVLLLGESGTGKECAAQWIHHHSPRRERPFVALNCAAIPDTQFSAELFGYEPGAFNGATRKRTGRIAEAEKGTLFLDEIGDMSQTSQATLLRFLETSLYTPLGGDQEHLSDVRIVSASNHNLHEEVHTGSFRLDLFHRLNVLSLDLPPLRQHLEDIPVLVEHFLHHHKPPVTLDSSAMDALMAHDFPGNVRELRNCLLRAAVSNRHGLIRSDDLGLEMPVRAAPPDQSLSQYRDRQESLYIRQCLEECKNNVQEAANRLKISRSSLYRLMEKHRIHLP
ncbi:MAG: sigma-54 interaction domain-containing protein [Alcanivorax nanhaiticus]